MNDAEQYNPPGPGLLGSETLNGTPETPGIQPQAPLTELQFPKLVLRLGVTGHRHLQPAGCAPEIAEERKAVMHQTLTAVFQAVSDELAAIGEANPFFVKATPRIRLVSSLADGADQLVVRAGLDLGKTGGPGAPELPEPKRCAFDLLCFLPFEVEGYLASSIENKTEFKRLFYGSTAEVVILDGRYDAEDTGSISPLENASRRRQRAYRACAWFILQHSDFLIAILDPNHNGKPGGTMDNVREALKAGVPVIWINPTEPRQVRMLTHLRQLDQSKPLPEDWRVQLRNLLNSVLVLPQGLEHRQANPAQSIEDFFCSKLPAKTVRGFLWRTTVRIWGGPRGEGIMEAGLEPYETYRKRASCLARHYADLYRGAFVLNYMLAFLATVLATLGLVMESAKAPLFALEFSIICFVLANTRQAHTGRWHEKAIDFRFLVEMLRAMNYLARLGCATPCPRLPAQYALYNPGRTWMNWLFRCLVRQSPAVVNPGQKTCATHFEKSYVKNCVDLLVNHWVFGQRQHHQGNSKQMGRIDQGIEFVGKWAYVAVVLAVALHGTLFVSGDHFSDMAHAVSRWLAFAAVVVPAWVVSLNGFVSQAECRRLHERSHDMTGELATAEDQFMAILDNARASEGAVSWTVAVESYGVAQLIINEVGDWRAIYRVHKVSAA